jgi:hypothetical protein
MFVRFRETRDRLQGASVGTRRIAGKVCHERIAGLGSIELTPTVEARADAELAGELRDMHAASVADHESLVDDFNVYPIRVIPVDDDEDARPLPFGGTGHAE